MNTERSGSPRRWIIQVHDRRAAVERVLGTLRRRAVHLHELTVARSSPSALVVVVDVRVDEFLTTRVCAELEASPDVIGVERTVDGGHTTASVTSAGPSAAGATRGPANVRKNELSNHTNDTRTEPGEDLMSEGTLFEDVDVDPERIRERRVAVIGYGSQGHAHALNLHDSGVEVVVGLHEGSSSAEAARAQGLRVLTVAEAAKASDLVALLIPDPVAPEVYREHIHPHLGEGDALLLAHGFNVHYGEIKPSPGVDVILVAPKSPGDMLRREYQADRGVPALLAVDRDASGSARELALSYAHALGCTRAGVLETTFAAETETDLFGEQAVLCGGFTALVKAGFETLVDAGYDPRLAYFECLHELKLIVDLAYAGGLSGMRSEVSDTAEFGDYVSGERVIGKESRAAMKDILEEVRSGSFARRWVDEWREGGSEFKRMREQEGRHPLDEVGVRLRRRMAWLER